MSKDEKYRGESYYQKNKERCMEAQRRYRSKPEVRERYLVKARDASKKWFANPENKIRKRRLDKENWKKEVKKLEEKAGRPRPERCELCGKTGRICFDHDHKTGKFRGWICMKCNTVLGKVGDDPKILQSLIDYLNKSVK